MYITLRSTPPPNMARSGRRWRGPEFGGCLCVRSRAVARCPLSKLPAAPLKPSVGRSLTPYAPGHARAVPPAPRRGCRIAPRERGALMRGCVGRAPSVAARGGPARCRRPYSPRVPPACAVGARPPPRCHGRRPTALAADTAGAAENLGVFYTRVMCRRAPRSINPASGAAEAGRWAVPPPQRGPAMRVACRQRWRVGAGSRRCSVGGFWKAAAGGRHRVRRAAGQRGAAGHSRRAYRPHVRWAPARRPAAHAAAQPRSQQTPLARPSTWAFFTMRSRAVARLGLSRLPAALLKLVLGCPQPVTPRRTAGQPGSRAYRAAGHTGQPGIPGSRAAGHTGQPDIPGSRTAGHTGQPDIPGSRTAGHTGQPGIPDRPDPRTFRIPTPAAQHRSQQTPLARPITWALCMTPSRADARLASWNLPAALLKLALGCPQPVQPSRTYRTAGHTRPPDRRTYRTAGHTGPPDRRTAGHTGPPDIPDRRTAGHTGPPGIPDRRAYRTAGHTGPPDIPDRRTYRTAGHTGPPGIPDCRTYRTAGHTGPPDSRAYRAAGQTAPPRAQPNSARSRHRWRGPQPGRFLVRGRVPTRASLHGTCQRRC